MHNSPDLDGFRKMFHGMLCRAPKKGKFRGNMTLCFTIFLFISPDLDGICFTICLFISPDLDGNRALRKGIGHTKTG